MLALKSIGVFLLTFCGMEGFSWFIHKYFFHGPLWFIHKTHHKKSHYWLELNDLFSLLFASAALYLMWFGKDNFGYCFWAGAGISVYGICYFIFHDWFIHNRIKSFKTSNRYLLAVRRAHKIHHRSIHKYPSEEFGLWLISSKNFKNLLNRKISVSWKSR